MDKTQTRKLAEQYGLTVSDKPDSQDICFVPTGGYAKVVERLRPGAIEAGDIIHHETGEVLGQHQGIIHYTIGQRRGIGIGGTEDPLYVIALNAPKHQVIVGPKEALMTDTVRIKEVNWLGGDIPPEGKPVLVKLRSVQEAFPATLHPIASNHTAHITLTPPQFKTAAGQACVFYDGTILLGGGWIF